MVRKSFALVSRGIDGVDQLSHVFLVSQSCLQWVHVILQICFRLVDSFQGNLQVVVLHVLQEQQSVIPFFLRLDVVPVCKSVQSLVFIKNSQIPDTDRQNRNSLLICVFNNCATFSLIILISPFRVLLSI